MQNKNQNKRIFYIADTHFGHSNIIKMDGRPFADIEEMDSEMIKRWNQVVSQNDHVYVVGDFAYKNNVDVSYYTTHLNGHIHLIRGNHDKRTDEYEKSFESVSDILNIKDTAYGQQRDVIMCHYWMPFVQKQRHGAYMLHGHTHTTKEHIIEEEMKKTIRDNGIRCEAYNVGCMFQDYYPQTLEQIIARQERDVVI